MKFIDLASLGCGRYEGFPPKSQFWYTVCLDTSHLNKPFKTFAPAMSTFHALLKLKLFLCKSIFWIVMWRTEPRLGSRDAHPTHISHSQGWLGL